MTDDKDEARRVFAEATTSTAFLLNLSKRQVNTLLRLRATDGVRHDFNIVQVDSLKPLDRRGLVYWKRDEQGRGAGFQGLTRAGELVADLCLEAGLTVENTNSLSVLGRMQRSAA